MYYYVPYGNEGYYGNNSVMTLINPDTNEKLIVSDCASFKSNQGYRRLEEHVICSNNGIYENKIYDFIENAKQIDIKINGGKYTNMSFDENDMKMIKDLHNDIKTDKAFSMSWQDRAYGSRIGLL